MPIPAANLRAQHDQLRAELTEAFRRVLDASAFIGGSEVQAFEREFAAYCGAEHAVGVANGTDALALALRALGVGAGDAVAVPAFTFAATAEAVCHIGARPVLVDIDPETFTLDPHALRRALQAERGPVRAIIPVHLYGRVAAMDEIGAIGRAVGAAVVEDAAQAHGARYGGLRAGALATLGCFSFYPTKNLGALGDAGAVTTNNADLAARIALLRDHGQESKYVHGIVGFNSRLDGLQAAMLRVKLQRLEQWNARRCEIAAAYRAALERVTEITLPANVPGHVYHLFVVRCRARAALQTHLAAEGIATAVHYPLPLHLQKAFTGLGYRIGDFPHAEDAAREVLALPMYPELSDEAVATVCSAVHRFASRPAAASG